MALTDPSLGLFYGWALGENGWNVGMDANLKKLGALLHLAVKSRAVSTPPSSPTDGDRYIIPSSATGDWAGHNGQVAVRIAGSWEYYTPAVGWVAYVEDESAQVVYTASGWTDASTLLELGTMATQNADNVNITGGTLFGTTPTPAGLALLDDVDAAAQRTTLGLGTMATQNANNVNITGGQVSANITGGTFHGVTPTTAGLALLDDADAAAQRTTLGLGTMATQNANSVNITGGTIFGVTPTPAGIALLDDADAAAQRATLGLGTVATKDVGTSGGTVPLLNGDNTFSGTSTFTGPVNTGRGTVTMHATAMDLWSLPPIIDGTGSAVTITSIANAPQAGAKRTLYVPAGTVIKNNSVFSVEGNADYTAQAGDAFVFEAKTTSTYNVWILRAASYQPRSANLDQYATVTPTPAGLALLDDADAAAQRATLGLGTMATQNADNVNITGGTLFGTVPTSAGLALLGAADAAQQRTLLGVSSGSGSGVDTGDIVFNDNIISTATTNADIVLSPNGTGKVQISNVNITGGTIFGVTPTTAGLALLDDADAAAQRATLGLGTVATKNVGTSGDTVPLLNGNNTFSGTSTFTGPVNTARGTITMHATAMDLWSQPNIIDGTGSAVTITSIVNAPQAGAVRTLYVPAGTVIKNNAMFSVEGGEDYTAQAGDAFVFEAKTTNTYNVWVLRAASYQPRSANLDQYAAVTPTAAGLALLDDADAAAQRATLGLGSAATTSASDYAPAAHVGSGGSAHAAAVPNGAAGFMTGSDKAKLDGIQSGATANSPDSVLLNRANHTGTQTASTISDFASAVDARIATLGLGTMATQNANSVNITGGTIFGVTPTPAGVALLDDADAAAQRTTLGLGTAATQNIGTSGATVPLLDGNNTFSGTTVLAKAGVGGVPSMGNKLHVTDNITNSTYTTLYAESNINNSSAPANHTCGFFIAYPDTNCNDFGFIASINAEVRNKKPGQFSSVASYVSHFHSLGGGSVTNRYGFLDGGNFLTDGTLTNSYSFCAGSNVVGATNIYGFYGDIPPGVGRWNFYANTTAENRFVGRTRFDTGFARIPTVSTAPDGSTITLTSSTNHLLYNNASPVAALTINLPTSDVTNGQEITIATRFAITALTVGGGTIYGAPTTLPAGGFATFIYSSAAAAWFRKG